MRMLFPFVFILLLFKLSEGVVREAWQALATAPTAGVFVACAVGGLAFGLTIAHAHIHNGIVEADRRADHASVDKKHDARRI